MKEPAAIAAELQETFERIRVERMAGVPILNPALSVEATEFREWESWHTGVLVTPWFINVVLIAREQEAECPISGTKKLFHLPAGAFEFIRSDEKGLGGFWMCSLFSPALEFGDQETAMAVAEASLAAMMAEGEDGGEDDGDADMERIWRGELPQPEEAPEPLAEEGHERDDRGSGKAGADVSRRAFLTAGAARGDAT